jgi:hypothetical protein
VKPGANGKTPGAPPMGGATPPTGQPKPPNPQAPATIAIPPVCLATPSCPGPLQMSGAAQPHRPAVPMPPVRMAGTIQAVQPMMSGATTPQCAVVQILPVWLPGATGVSPPPMPTVVPPPMPSPRPVVPIPPVLRHATATPGSHRGTRIRSSGCANRTMGSSSSRYATLMVAPSPRATACTTSFNPREAYTLCNAGE